jgi:hypothetical protein
MTQRGNHSIEYVELERGLHELNSDLFGFEPPMSMDRELHYYEPQGGIITGIRTNGHVLTGVLRGFIPRHNLPVLKDKPAQPRWGWQYCLQRIIAEGGASERAIERKFGITLHSDISPYTEIERSEDRADV